jgi:hypothetical protein
VDDLALDCIAELFERDADGGLVVLQDYFGDLGATDRDAAGLQIDLRRLVLSKVNDALFRRHRDVDPGLGRIIRNLKLGARSHPRACVRRHRGVAWLFADESAAAAGLNRPLAPPSLLEGYLAAAANETTQIPQVLEAFCAFARDHPFYVAGFPLSRFAVLVRGAFSHLHRSVNGSSLPEAPALLERRETLAVLDSVVEAVRADMQASYVGRGKVAADTFEAYLRAGRELLAARFVEANREDLSYYEALHRHLEGLSHRAYREAHRHRFEYVMKKLKRRFVEVSRQVLT